jgi:hypothetical protein
MLFNFSRYFIAVLIFLTSINIYAQDLSVKAEIDTNLMLIGDQINITLELNKTKGLNVDFPLLKDTLMENIEIYEISPIDTLYNKDGKLSLQQNYTITSFDTGMYIIPPFDFIIIHDTIFDTLKSNPLFLQVFTMQIDTTKQAIADIKAPIETPWTVNEFFQVLGKFIKEYKWYIIIGILSVLVAVTALMIFLKRKKKKKDVILKKPLEPAHIIALRDLDALKSKKLWQNDKVKKYHSELTGIIRTYIENRFDIMALEQTSLEIIQSFERSNLIDEQSANALQQLLSIADFVKFAKALPLPDENDRCIKNAYQFVNNTIPAIKEEEIVDNDNNEEVANV